MGDWPHDLRASGQVRWTRLLSLLWDGDARVQKGCAHRYERDESFTTICIEVSLSQKLEDGLEKYVQGEVLDEYRVRSPLLPPPRPPALDASWYDRCHFPFSSVLVRNLLGSASCARRTARP